MSNKFKYYLTFDVGIKNLAYCLIRHDVTKNIINGIDIIKWGVLDVSFKPLICKHIVNKRKICNKISFYYLLKENNNNHNNHNNLIGYCKDHFNNLKITNKSLQKQLFRISKNLIFKDNFNIQIERLLLALEIFFQNDIISLYHTENPENETQTYSEFLINNLEIYIENQPVFKNPIMKSISIAIFTFFTLKKIMFPQIIKFVNFISASDKTKLIFINSMKKIININSTITDFKNYDNRKEFSIQITNQFITNLNKSIFNIVALVNYYLNKKKDDMADTFIYIIYILLKQ